MSATTVTAARGTSSPARASATPGTPTVPARTPFRRLLRVEARKMFDTRSGRWLMISILALATIATICVVAFAPRDQLTYSTFATAIGVPMAVILPVVAMLTVASEWSQRTALTTFTLVPSRSRVLAAKAVVIAAVGVTSMTVAGAVGALGNLGGTAIAGVDPVWDVTWIDFGQIVLSDLTAMAMGFTFALLTRSSPGAIVAFFTYSLVLPAASGALAALQPWWAENGAWFDHVAATDPLFDGALSAHEWAQLGVTSLFWLVIPLAVGVRAALRSEVK